MGELTSSALKEMGLLVTRSFISVMGVDGTKDTLSGSLKAPTYFSESWGLLVNARRDTRKRLEGMETIKGSSTASTKERAVLASKLSPLAKHKWASSMPWLKYRCHRGALTPSFPSVPFRTSLATLALRSASPQPLTAPTSFSVRQASSLPSELMTTEYILRIKRAVWQDAVSRSILLSNFMHHEPMLLMLFSHPLRRASTALFEFLTM